MQWHKGQYVERYLLFINTVKNKRGKKILENSSFSIFIGVDDFLDETIIFYRADDSVKWGVLRLAGQAYSR